MQGCDFAIFAVKSSERLTVLSDSLYIHVKCIGSPPNRRIDAPA